MPPKRIFNLTRLRWKMLRPDYYTVDITRSHLYLPTTIKMNTLSGNGHLKLKKIGTENKLKRGCDYYALIVSWRNFLFVSCDYTSFFSNFHVLLSHKPFLFHLLFLYNFPLLLPSHHLFVYRSFFQDPV
jgi:hypothetical protein